MSQQSTLLTKAEMQRYLESVGFTLVYEENDRVWLDSKGAMDYGYPLQVMIYPNAAGFYSLDVDGGYCAGMAVDETGEDKALLAWLNQHHAGWDKS